MSTSTVHRQPFPTEPGQLPSPRIRSSTTERLELGLDLDTPTRTPWAERLRELSQLAATSPGTVYIEPDTEKTIHAHLDAIESILRDPRPELTREIGNYRRRSLGCKCKPSVEVKENAITTEDLEAEVEYQQENGVDQAIVLAQLTGLLREVTLLNGEVERRREEAREIRDLFEERCRRLTRTVAELEDEVVELYGRGLTLCSISCGGPC